MFDRDLVVFGELHGTVEAPALVGDVLAEAAMRGPVSLGIEWPEWLQPTVDRFLVTGDRAALLATPDLFWSWRDGRSSVAMIDLLERARVIGARVVCFDGASAGALERDADMAARVLAARPRFVLCGNRHARTIAPAMGSYLRAVHPALLAIDLCHAGGTAWCRLDREPGIVELGGIDGARGPRLYAHRDERGYDGEINLGPIHASPPAG